MHSMINPLTDISAQRRLRSYARAASRFVGNRAGKVIVMDNGRDYDEPGKHHNVITVHFAGTPDRPWAWQSSCHRP
jgi:hypothetical protein